MKKFLVYWGIWFGILFSIFMFIILVLNAAYSFAEVILGNMEMFEFIIREFASIVVLSLILTFHSFIEEQ